MTSFQNRFKDSKNDINPELLRFKYASYKISHIQLLLHVSVITCDFIIPRIFSTNYYNTITISHICTQIMYNAVRLTVITVSKLFKKCLALFAYIMRTLNLSKEVPILFT